MNLEQGRRRFALIVAVAAVSTASVPARAVVSSAIANLNINTFLGADRFYAAGFTGSDAVAANIEAGYVWKGHSALTGVTVQIKAPNPEYAGTALGSYSGHPTIVGGMIAGHPAGPSATNERARGIAYNATLWTGAIATYFGSNGSFDWDPDQTGDFTPFAYPYVTAMQTGLSGVTADVINSSWGGSGSPAGDNICNYTVDGLANANGTTVVFSAGNSGGANSVGYPGNGYNLLCVAALANSTTYNSAAGFSSRGPETYKNPVTGQTVAGVRAVISIAAPGDGLWGTAYSTASPPNTNGYSSGNGGTSFSAPIVAGGATLVVDAGRQSFPANPSATDGRVVKAVLLNSASKTLNWTNGQTTAAGVVRTTQSLDWVVGAGRMNLSAAYDQYLTGTTDVPGAGGTGALVSNIGWDYNSVSEGVAVEYPIAPALVGGAKLTATLDWFVDRVYSGINEDGVISASDNSFDNLDLQVYRTDAGPTPLLVAESVSLYNNVEHLYFNLPATGTYALRVVWTGELYDRLGDVNTELFALAWSTIATPIALPGDFNLDGSVDAADYTVWADSFGTTGQALAADGNRDGRVDAADYTVWSDHFGSSTPAGTPAVPEPTAAGALLGSALMACSRMATRKRRR